MCKHLLLGVLCLLGFNSMAQQADSLKRIDLEEVTITTTRSKTQLKDIPQKVEVIDRAVIMSIPSDNAAEILKRTANIDIIQYPGMSASIGMRGFSPSAHSRSYTLLLINGIPTASTNASSINMDNVERIEVIKGPYSALYGSDAMGGVINIITKPISTESSGQVTLSAGNFGYMKLGGSVSSLLSRKTAISLGYTRTEQAKNYRIGSNNILGLNPLEEAMLDPKSSGDIMENSTFQWHEATLRLQHAINNRWSSSADVIYTLAHDINTPGNYWGSYGQSKKDIDRLNLQTCIKRTTDSNVLTIMPYFSQEAVQNYSNNSDTGFVSLSATVREYGVKANNAFALGNVKMLVGADLDIYTYLSTRYSDAAVETNAYQPDNSLVKGAVFAQATYMLGGLLVNAGARVDQIHYAIDANDLLKSKSASNSYTSFNPSFGAQYTFPFNVKLHASVGSAFSVPDAFKVAGKYSVSEYFPKWDYWWVKNYKGNADLEPEKSVTYDFGVGYTSENKLLHADVTLFSTNHSNRIVEYTIPGTDTTSFKNAKSSTYRGVEVLASVNVGKLFTDKFKLELYANYTHLFESTFKDDKKDAAGNMVPVELDMQYTRKANGSFGIFFDTYKGLSSRLNARYIGSRLEKDNFAKLRPAINAGNYYVGGGYTAADKMLKHSAYLVFDYSVAYTVNKSKRFGITISNLLDENYTEKDGYNMPGRSIIGTFTYSF